VLSERKEEGIAKALKASRVTHRQEETCGKRSGDLRVNALKYFPRENGSLREVMKSGVNPDHWIWKGHVEEFHTFQRSGAPE
jgi:hypothetical protein